MTGGAAAALTGLVFVAVSLHARTVIENVLHRDRAWSTIVLLASLLIVSAAVLVPAQPVRLLGAELTLIALFWIYRTVYAWKVLGSSMRRLDRRLVHWQIEWGAWIAWTVALVASCVALLAENGAYGFPLLALAVVGMFGFAIWSSWVLISEVSD